jgi:fructokinase
VLSVLGEFVVDLLPDVNVDADDPDPRYVARPGGNALNVAVAAARLGTPVHLLARLGTGPLAAGLRRQAERAGVDVSGIVPAREPVSVAFVGLGPDGSPDYGFHVLGAADWQWTDDEIAAVYPQQTAILHVGSISAWTAPGSEAIARLVERISTARSALVSVDPNIRPVLAEGFGNTAERVRARLDRLLAHADIVKVSSEDLRWLEPDSPQDPATLDETAQRWAERGPALVLLTHGGGPLRVARPGRPLLRRVPPQIAVVDTVGAGDSLAAGLFSGLLAAGVADRSALDALADDRLTAVVDDAMLVAAINCTRVGADPPTRDELEAARPSVRAP